MLAVVSAVQAEIDRLIQRLDAKMGPESKTWQVPGESLVLAALGVGYLEAALRLSELLQKTPKIERLMFTGSAGVYPGVDHLRPGDLCSCRETILIDGMAELGISHYAPPLPRQAIASTLPVDDQLPNAAIATALSLTASDASAAAIQKSSGMEIETMELYGVAYLCLQRSIPWNAVMAITNRVGDAGHQEWKQHYSQLAEKSCDRLLVYLPSLL